MGAVAAVLRFVPYIGPLIGAVFPVALAFAVHDGWSLVFWTAALIVTLELISNNIVEPLLYGASTGLSAISLIAAAVFWAALWGAPGLLLSTPITVCLLVLGVIFQNSSSSKPCWVLHPRWTFLRAFISG